MTTEPQGTPRTLQQNVISAVEQANRVPGLEAELAAAQAKLAAAEEKRNADIRSIEQTALQLRDKADKTPPTTIESIRNLEHLMGQAWAYNLFAKKLRAAFPDVFKEKDNGN